MAGPGLTPDPPLRGAHLEFEWRSTRPDVDRLVRQTVERMCSRIMDILLSTAGVIDPTIAADFTDPPQETSAMTDPTTPTPSPVSLQYATCPATVLDWDPDHYPTEPEDRPQVIARVCGEDLFLTTETDRELHRDGTTEPPGSEQVSWSLKCPSGHVVASPDWPDGTPVEATADNLAAALRHAERAEMLEPALQHAYAALVRLAPGVTDPELVELTRAARDHARQVLADLPVIVDEAPSAARSRDVVVAWDWTNGEVLGALIRCPACGGPGEHHCDVCNGDGTLHRPYELDGRPLDLHGSFTAEAVDAGGRHVDLLVDTDTTDYPPKGVTLRVLVQRRPTDEAPSEDAERSERS